MITKQIQIVVCVTVPKPKPFACNQTLKSALTLQSEHNRNIVFLIYFGTVQFLCKRIEIMLAFFRRKSVESDSTVGNDRTKSKPRSMSISTLATTEEAIPIGEDALLKELGYRNTTELKETIYDALRTIRDPEKPHTLEDLNVVYEEGVFVQSPTSSNVYVIRVEFNPTVPHCTLATLIGLCIRVKIERSLPHNIKLDIYIKKGAHSTEDEINKQINDKERIAAAMENPNLRDLVENCIKDEE